MNPFSGGRSAAQRLKYMGSSVTTERNCLGPYRRPMPRLVGGVLGGWVFSSGRGNPVHAEGFHSTPCAGAPAQLPSACGV